MAVISIANKAGACIADKGADVTIVFSGQIAINHSLQSAWILTNNNVATAGPDSAFDVNSFFCLSIYGAVIINNAPFVREQI